MSHHFDSATAREDSRLNLCDLYLFDGAPGRTVMAMTVNPNADPAAAALFRAEGLYAFRFDTDGDSHEDVSFKVRFGEARQDDGRHVQSVQVHRATGPDADHGIDGERIAHGDTFEIIDGDGRGRGVKVFAGDADDLFAADAAAFESFEEAFAQGGYQPEAFADRPDSDSGSGSGSGGSASDFFASRRVAAIVLEVPNELIGGGMVHAWATVSLIGHAPERQVARWGLPLITHLYLRDDAMREDFNASRPSEADGRFTGRIAEVVRETTSRAKSTANPAEYANRLVRRFGRITLPYEIGTPASFDYIGFNGRRPRDDVMDVMLSLTTNTALGDGVAPDPQRLLASFPYLTAAG